MSIARPPKGYYNENEAAQALGVTLEEFRTLVRRHLLESDDDLASLPRMYYQPSDLVVLRLLASSRTADACVSAG
ncbi:MAG: hypothetical protein N2036_13770 [Bryobacteraceae bacterium]|nr:hypothetical protein [Bryobacteraceae bacterium]